MAAAREYVRLMCRHWWQTFFAIGFGIIGALADTKVMETPIPTWTWYVLAFGSFAVAQYMSFVTLHKEVSAFRKEPEPNMALKEIYDRVCYSLAADDNLSNFDVSAMIEVKERALLGKLQIFGTRVPPSEEDGALERIDSEFWRDHEFEFPVSYKLSRNEERKRSHTVGEGDVFFNLQVDELQATLCWPRKTRLKLQWPFGREVV